MKYRTAEDLLPIVQTVLGASGSASVDRGTNSLVLVGDPAAVGDVLQLLAEQDRKLRTVVLHYGNKRLQDLEARGIDVRWTAQAGSFRIGNVRRPRGSGSSVSVRANDVDRSSAETLSGVLRVQEGETGRIETGQTVPFTTGNRFGTNTQLVTASTGFEARAADPRRRPRAGRPPTLQRPLRPRRNHRELGGFHARHRRARGDGHRRRPGALRRELEPRAPQRRAGWPLPRRQRAHAPCGSGVSAAP